jgi:uncharacterized protein
MTHSIVSGRSRRQVALFFLAGVSALASIAPIAVRAQAPAGESETRLEKLTFQTAGGPRLFQVEVARTPAERERGLMFRRFMPADRGMLFDFDNEQTVMMWMKNTYIPLDMVFISRAGAVVNIAENTEPLSERIIPSVAPAYAVVELNGGVANKIGLKVGDRVEHPMFTAK